MVHDGNPALTNTGILSDESGLDHITPTEMTASLVSHRAVRAADSPTPLSDVATETFIFTETVNSLTVRDDYPMSASGRDPTMVPNSPTRSAPHLREHLKMGADGFGTTYNSTAWGVLTKAGPSLDEDIIEVLFVSDVPDEGFILGHAGKLYY